MENLSQASVDFKRSSFFTFSRKVAVINLFILVVILLNQDQLMGISPNLYHFVAWLFMYVVFYHFKPRDRFDSYFYWPLLYPLLIWIGYYLLISEDLFVEQTVPKALGIVVGMVYMSIVRYFSRRNSELN